LGVEEADLVLAGAAAGGPLGGLREEGGGGRDVLVVAVADGGGLVAGLEEGGGRGGVRVRERVVELGGVVAERLRVVDHPVRGRAALADLDGGQRAEEQGE
jgi:hypothetical protein